MPEGDITRSASERLTTGELLRIVLINERSYDSTSLTIHETVLAERIGDIDAYLLDQFAVSGEITNAFRATTVRHAFTNGRWKGPWRGNVYLCKGGLGFHATSQDFRAGVAVAHLVGGLPLALLAHGIGSLAPEAPQVRLDRNIPLNVAAEMFPETAAFVPSARGRLVQRMKSEFQLDADDSMIRWRCSLEDATAVLAWATAGGISVVSRSEPGWLERIWEALR